MHWLVWMCRGRTAEEEVVAVELRFRVLRLLMVTV